MKAKNMNKTTKSTLFVLALTALAIGLVILLGVWMDRADREEIVTQFGQRQLLLAEQTAAGIQTIFSLLILGGSIMVIVVAAALRLVRVDRRRRVVAEQRNRELAALNEKVEQSERRYRTILESSADAIVSLDPDMKIAAWSAGAEQIFGYTREETIGRLPHMLVPDHDRQPTAKRLEEVRQRGFVRGWQTQRRAKDRRLVDVEVTVTDLGPELGLTAILRDITEPKRAKEELSVAYDALDSSVAGVIMADLEGKIRYANPAFLRMFEYEDRDQVIGKRAAELFPAARVQKFSDVQAIIDRVEGETEEFLTQRKDGTLFHVEVSSSVVTDNEGNDVGRMASFVEISERKRAEGELRKCRDHLEKLVEERTQALRESERALRDLMESVPIGTAISTPGAQGTVSDVNATLLQTFGYASKEEFLEMPASAHYYDPEERGRFSELRRRGPVKNYETRFKRKDGTVFWGSVTSIARTTEAGRRVSSTHLRTSPSAGGRRSGFPDRTRCWKRSARCFEGR